MNEPWWRIAWRGMGPWKWGCVALILVSLSLIPFQ